MSHHPSYPLLTTSDGRNFNFMEPVLTDPMRDGSVFRIPMGSSTDGLSAPSELWWKWPPFGFYWLDAAWHDAAYRGTLERQRPDGTWALAMLTKEQSDDYFLELLMKNPKVDMLERDAFYEGVKYGGWRSFREDRSAIPPESAQPAPTAPDSAPAAGTPPPTPTSGEPLSQPLQP